MKTKPELRLTEKQQRIMIALSKEAPEIAKLYEGGLRIIDQEESPGRVYLLGHALREIRNRVPDHFDIPTPARVPYSDFFVRISPHWKTAVRPRLETTAEELTTQPPLIAIPIEVAMELDELVRRHDESVGIKRDRHINFLASRDVPGAPATYPEPVVKQWINIPGEKFAHMRAGNTEPPIFEECLKYWHIMEDILHAILAPMHESIREIDEILKEANA